MKILIHLIFISLFASSMWAQSWHHWRGPSQNGVAEDKNLPSTWSKDGENLIWKADYGARSAPLVMNGMVYMINSAGENEHLQERVLALDAKTGKLVWEHRFNVFHTDIVAHRVGWANLGGDLETGNVYAHGVQGRFFCFSKDGKVLWSRSLTEEFGRISGYGGRTNTPVVDGDLVIISFLSSGWGKHGRGKHRYLAMNKHSGQVVWWSDPGEQPLDTTYSVPVIAEIDGIRLLITGCADGFIYALNIHTGERRWGYQFSKRGINSSVVVQNHRVFATHSEENIDNNLMGSIVCIDGRGKGDITKTGTLWRRDGTRVGYTSPIVDGNNLYVMDNSANIHCINTENGKTKWEFNYGTVAKGSGVLADGKIYVGVVGGVYVIAEPSETGCKLLDEEHFTLKDGSPIEINGSPAISDGYVYLPTGNSLYCIGSKEKQSSGTKAQLLQIVPAETWISPKESVQFTAQLFDGEGKFVKNGAAKWTVSGLNGNIDEHGNYTAGDDNQQQAGEITAEIDGLTATARLRIIPKLPYKEDFNSIAEGTPPPGWITSKLKCQVVELDGEKVLKKMADRPAPPFARLKAYIQPPLPAGYTIQADLRGDRKKRFYPDLGLINCRYTLILLGTTLKPQLRLVSWDPMPRIQKDVAFKWKTNKWYTAKLRVDLQDNKALVRGKVWPRGEEEPQEWSIELVDPCPNLGGSPGLYAYSVGITSSKPGTPVYFDNVEITNN